MTAPTQEGKKAAREINQILPVSVLDQGLIETLGISEASEQYELEIASLIDSFTNLPALLESHKTLVEALTRIRDGAELCECDHTTKDCCALQHPIDFVCPFCIADIALAKAKEVTDGKRD